MTQTTSSIEDAFQNSSLIGMTCVPIRVSKQTSVAEAVFSHCSDGVRGSAWLEMKTNAGGNLRGL